MTTIDTLSAILSRRPQPKPLFCPACKTENPIVSGLPAPYGRYRCGCGEEFGSLAELEVKE